MPWVKIDVDFPNHPKVAVAGWKAAWLYVCGLTYCSKYLTDGRIPKAQVTRLSDVPRPFIEADHLVAAGLWLDAGGDYIVHDYTAWQSSAEKVEAERERGRKRAAASAEARAKKRTASASASGEATANVREPEVRGQRLENPLLPETGSRPAFDEGAEEEEDRFTAEARRRLRATTSDVTDPTAWVRTTAKRLQDEGWRCPPVATTPHPLGTPAARPACDTCNSLSLIEDHEGNYQPCPTCTKSATA